MVQQHFWLNCQSCLSKATFVGDLVDERCCPAAAPSLPETHWACFGGAAAKSGLFFPQNKLILDRFNLKVVFMAPKMGFRGLGLGFFCLVCPACVFWLSTAPNANQVPGVPRPPAEPGPGM